jgi:hypothetical protein
LKQISGANAGKSRETTVPTSRGPKTLSLPCCPACRMLSLYGYRQELTTHGFRVLSAQRHGGLNFGYEAIIVAEKP